MKAPLEKESHSLAVPSPVLSPLRRGRQRRRFVSDSCPIVGSPSRIARGGILLPRVGGCVVVHAAKADGAVACRGATFPEIGESATQTMVKGGGRGPYNGLG